MSHSHVWWQQRGPVAIRDIRESYSVSKFIENCSTMPRLCFRLHFRWKLLPMTSKRKNNLFIIFLSLEQSHGKASYMFITNVKDGVWGSSEEGDKISLHFLTSRWSNSILYRFWSSHMRFFFPPKVFLHGTIQSERLDFCWLRGIILLSTSWGYVYMQNINSLKSLGNFEPSFWVYICSDCFIKVKPPFQYFLQYHHNQRWRQQVNNHSWTEFDNHLHLLTIYTVLLVPCNS